MWQAEKIHWKLNGVAMLGDYCSAASFLGVAGAISLSGIDSWWIAIGFFSAWVVVLLALAGPLKSAGKFTVGDILVSRFGGGSLKFLAMAATVIVSTLYLVPQIIGAGHLFELLLGWNYLTTVFVTGGFMGMMVVVGGMTGTTYNQALPRHNAPRRNALPPNRGLHSLFWGQPAEYNLAG